MNQQTILFLFFVYYLGSGLSWLQLICMSVFLISGFLYLIYRNQEKLLYLNEAVPPKRTSDNPSPFQNPKQMGLEYTDLHLTTPDNIKLHCWWIPQSNSAKCATIIFFHENAGNIGFRLPNICKMFHDLKVNIFMLSYRGYGESEGEPSEEGLKIDAKTTFDYIRKNNETLKMDRKRIYLFGRSLGGAVAIHLASQHSDELAGIILENTFTCIGDMVKKVFRFLDFDIVKKYLLRLEWRSIDLIDQITCPILFLSSGKDEIVPSEQMVALHRSASSAHFKSWHCIPQAMHNDAWLSGGEDYWKEISSFLDNCEKRINKISTEDTD